jgi:hypothetical protein
VPARGCRVVVSERLEAPEPAGAGALAGAA